MLAALAAAGAAGAALGKAPRGPAIFRNVAGGLLAMAVTYGIGSLARHLERLMVVGADQGVTPDRFSPTTPASIRPIDVSLRTELDSPSAMMPTRAVPAAPIPVHTA